jgi:hypothetical protein
MGNGCLSFLLNENVSPARFRAGLGITGSSIQSTEDKSQRGGTAMQIEKHDKSHIVKLEDGSTWRIWPGDIALTLRWLPTTVLQVSAIDDEFCSHALNGLVSRLLNPAFTSSHRSTATTGRTFTGEWG